MRQECSMSPSRWSRRAVLLQSRRNGGRSGRLRFCGKGSRRMRVQVTIIMCGLLAACTSTVTVPDDQVMYEVPAGGTASSTGGDAFTTTIESALADDGLVASPVTAPGSPTVA